MKTLVFTLCLLMIGIDICGAQSSLERGVIEEMNLARTNPRAYAGYLKEYRKLYRGKYIYPQGNNVRIATSEGLSAVDEAIRFLMRQQQVAPLQYSSGLAEAAADLVEDQCTSGDTGHSGRVSGSMDRRIERHGKWQGSIGENISYGYDDARLVVIQLIVDDAVRGRGHRKNMFNPAFRRAGVACGSHAEYGAMCVIDYAGGFSQ
jgi:uncharacterized protein YkwD